MKLNSLYKNFALVAAFAAALAACTEDITDVRLDADMSTTQNQNVTAFTAEVEGYIVARNEAFTEVGIVYALTEEPTLESGDKVVYEEERSKAAFTVTLTDLDYARTYYARAYGIYSGGVVYGEQLTFTTLPRVPMVTTSSLVYEEGDSAAFSAEVTDAGRGEITERGVVYATTEDPTVETGQKIADDEGGLGEYAGKIKELLGNTTYYVRAYAINGGGVGYGEAMEWTTEEVLLPEITQLYVVGDYNDWTNEEEAVVPFIISTETSEGLADGYIYLTAGEIKFIEVLGSWADETTFGDDGAGSLTSPGENIPVAEDGLYYITANLAEMTYSLLKMNWGIIGDATPGGWDGQTPLAYEADLNVLKGAFAMTVGEFKFRANDSWSYNYGSDEADGNLRFDGSNIPVEAEGDYAITLDLSAPHAYTYSANRWGIIGNATPGGWDADTFMSWDTEAEVFTVTADLVAGEIKFRANADWDVNFGGDWPALNPDGANIVIDDAGNYTLTLNPWTGEGSITLNE